MCSLFVSHQHSFLKFLAKKLGVIRILETFFDMLHDTPVKDGDLNNVQVCRWNVRFRWWRNTIKECTAPRVLSRDTCAAFPFIISNIVADDQKKKTLAFFFPLLFIFCLSLIDFVSYLFRATLSFLAGPYGCHRFCFLYLSFLTTDFSVWRVNFSAFSTNRTLHWNPCWMWKNAMFRNKMGVWYFDSYCIWSFS